MHIYIYICICLWEIAKFIGNLPAIRYDRILYKCWWLVRNYSYYNLCGDHHCGWWWWAVVGFKMFQVKWCNVSFLLAEVFSECRIVEWLLVIFINSVSLPEAIDSFGNRYLLCVFENKADAEKAFDVWNKEYEQVGIDWWMMPNTWGFPTYWRFVGPEPKPRLGSPTWTPYHVLILSPLTEFDQPQLVGGGTKTSKILWKLL